MFRIEHSDAQKLENQVRKLFNCDRYGVSGLTDASHFESCPMHAAIMVVSYIHAKALQDSELQYDEFLSKYGTIFRHPEENDAEHKVQNYIEELTKIIDRILDIQRI